MGYCVVAGISCGIHHIRGCGITICIMRDAGDGQGRRTICPKFDPRIRQQIPYRWNLYSSGQGRRQLAQVCDNDGWLLLASASVVSYRRQRTSRCPRPHAQSISIDIVAIEEGFPSGLFRRIDA